MADKTKLVVELIQAAEKDLKRYGGKERKWAMAVFQRLEDDFDALWEAGYIEPLEDKEGKKGTKLAGMYKIKNAGMGIRIVLHLSKDGVRTSISVVGIDGDKVKSDADKYATIIGVGQRKDGQVYQEAEKRKNRLLKEMLKTEQKKKL